MIQLYHANDPKAPSPLFCWDYVYLHGQAEDDMSTRQNDHHWEWIATDMVFACQDIPAPGEYEVEIYGKKAIAVIAQRFSHILGGRIAYANDDLALNHARTPKDWR